MTQEEKIKYYFLPYQAHLKITQIGEYQDDVPMIPDTPQPEQTAWAAFDETCSYTLPQKNVPNASMTRSFVKNDCPPNYVPVGSVPYTVAAGTYVGYNLNEANLYALQDIYANGQDHANATGSCIRIIEELLFTTDGSKDTSSFAIWLNQWSGTITEVVTLIVKQGSTIIKEVVIPVGSGAPFNIDLEQDNVEVYIKSNDTAFVKIKELSIDGLAGADWGIDSIYPDIFPELVKLTVTGQTQLTSINLLSNIKITTLELHDNSITGLLDTAGLAQITVYRVNNNLLTNITNFSTNHPNISYFNANDNPLNGIVDFTNCDDIQEVWCSRTNISNIILANKPNLTRVAIAQCPNLNVDLDFTTCPELRVIEADSTPLTDIIWDSNTKIEGFFVSFNTIPQSSITSGIDSNRSALKAISLQTMNQMTTINLDDCPKLHFLWAASLQNLTSLSFNNTGLITNLNIAGTPSLTTLPNLTTNPLNGFVWVTSSGIGSSGIDTILNHISSLNIPPISEHPAGQGAIIYGVYEHETTSLFPTSASLAAYNDLNARNYTLIGPVPA